jgi:hypothetical protein
MRRESSVAAVRADDAHCRRERGISGRALVRSARRDEQEAKAERAKEKIAHHVESKGWVEKETILSVASLMSTHFSYCLISGRIIMAAKAESQGEIAAMKNRLPVEGGEQQAPILGQEPEQGEAKAFSAYHASGDVILEVLGFSTMLVGHPPRDVPNGDNTQEAVVETTGRWRHRFWVNRSMASSIVVSG